EAEWFGALDAVRMVRFLRHRVSDRKLKLFLVAAARCIWDLIPEGEMRRAVELAEQDADGLADQTEVKASRSTLYGYFLSGASPDQREWVFGPPEKRRVFAHCFSAGYTAEGLKTLDTMNYWCDTQELTGQEQIGLIREIMGNPFRPVSFSPEW